MIIRRSIALSIVTIGMLGALIAGCSNASTSATPTTQSTAGHVAVLGNCPPDTITFGPGDNGTYDTPVGDTCTMYGPADVNCLPPSEGGMKYLFYPQSGGSNGVLSGTTQTGEGSTATFKRTSSGAVVIGLLQETESPIDCHITSFTYGTVTLKT
jgi:hypothetical protein